MRHTPTIRARLLSGLPALQAVLEPLNKPVMVGRTKGAQQHKRQPFNRYAVLGVSSRMLDVLIGPVHDKAVIEIGPNGRAARPRMVVRPLDKGHLKEKLPGANLRIAVEENKLTIRLIIGKRQKLLWKAEYKRDEWQLPSYPVRSFVAHYFFRYYRHLPLEVIDEVTMRVQHSTQSRAQLNRAIGREFYAVSVERGWKLVSKEERARYQLPAGNWQRETVMVSARARYHGAI